MRKRKPTRCPRCRGRRDRPWFLLLVRGRILGKASEPFGGLAPCRDDFHGLGAWARAKK